MRMNIAMSRTRIDTSNKGRRVELIRCNDPYTSLRAGSQGTYDMAIINVGLIQHAIKWDDGSSLMLIGSKDRFRFIE